MRGERGHPGCACVRQGVAPVGQVRGHHVVRQPEGVAEIPGTPAEHRDVHGDHQCPATGRDDPGQQVTDEGPVAQPVELEPHVRADSGDLFERCAAQRARQVRDPGRAGRRGEAQFPVRVHQALVRHRRHPDRHGVRAAEQPGAEVDGVHPAQHPGQHGDPVQRATVGRHCHLGRAAAVDVVPHVLRQHRAGPLGVVGERHGRQVGQHRLNHRAPPCPSGRHARAPARTVPAGTPPRRPAPAGRR